MKRGIWLGVLVLAAATSAIAEDTEELPRWGLGWLSQSRAPTVRVRLGDWNLGLAAKPQDHMRYEESWGRQSWGQAVPDSLHDIPEDTTNESGWVRLDVDRRLKSWGPVTLPLMLAFSYSWSDFKYTARFWKDEYQGVRVRIAEGYSNSYSLILALRPSWRIKPWISIETEFGLKYNWSNHDNTEIRSDPEWEDDRQYFAQSHYKSFNSHGWSSGSSLGMLSLLFWF